MKIKNNRQKFHKKIIVFAIIMLATLLVNNVARAEYGRWNGDENGGMVSQGIYSLTGLLPQIWKDKEYVGKADTEYPYEEWRIDLTPGTVYCDNYGSLIRFGSVDGTTYYAGNGESISNLEPLMRDHWNRKALDELDKVGRWQNFSMEFGSSGYSGNINPGAPVFMLARGGGDNYWESVIRAQMTAIFTKLTAWSTAGDVKEEPPLNIPKGDSYEYGGSLEYGPIVAVMEPYEKKETIEERNTALAYILTAMEDCYSATEEALHKKYSLSDIQTANWKEVDPDKPDWDEIEKKTENGMKLYDVAHKYADFAKKYVDGDEKLAAELDISQAQVVVNQETKNYIVGPLSMKYEHIEDISYIKSMHLITETGEVLLYDDWHKDFEILCTGETIKSSNGLTTEFPAPDAQFYVKFSAEKAKYPKNVKIGADFEYIKETYIKYNKLESGVILYQYFGYVYERSDHSPNIAWGTATGTISYDRIETEYYYTREEVWNDDKCIYEWKYIQHSRDVIVESVRNKEITIGPGDTTYGVKIVQPFIRMEGPVDNEIAQELKLTLEGHRTYDVYSVETNVDLTMELGGKVWVDGEAGKENAFDGIFNTQTDKPMPNVKVSLYRINGLDGNLPGEFVEATTTNENGNYLFEDVNSMFQYYVKFTYNGQYYQPTIYNAKRDDANWVNNSKGLDILSERDEFNAQFSEIGSAPQNTVECETAAPMHTRQELQDAGLIDEFGNIVGELDENGERTSEDSYVNYSMMDSYTCNGTSTKDIYPGFHVFVVDEYLNSLTNTKEVLEFIESDTVEILYGNPDVMHYVNQGYVLRELVDLALRKDVYKTTLEINGKTQVYKYNKREPLYEGENGEKYWNIETRVSDQYYNYEYSREIYREDYDYKIDNYGLNFVDGVENTTLENLGLSEDSELKIYVTYKYTIRNRSEHIATRVTEVVDYYDSDYTYVPDLSYIGDANGNKIADVQLKDNSRYDQATETKMSEGYKNLYITGTEKDEYGQYSDENLFPLSDPDDTTKDVYFYVTFIVNKDDNRNNILDETIDGTAIGAGKENITEINGYKSYYGQKAEAPNKDNDQTEPEYVPGDIAGIPDTNSTPGNLDPNDVPKDGPVNFQNFENDTDKAPNIRIILNRDNVRTIEGTVWEDARTEDSNLAKVGNGFRNDGETGVNGVRVQLVELRHGNDGKIYEYVWKEVYSGNSDEITPIINNSGIIGNYAVSGDGKYKFTSFAPGNYIVRFIYGSGESSILGTHYTNYNTGEQSENPVTALYAENGYNRRVGTPGYSASSSNIGLNYNSYNGQDYKSTSYQKGLYNYDASKEIDDNYSETTSFAYNDQKQLVFQNYNNQIDFYNFTEADKKLYSDAKDKMNSKDSNVINLAPVEEYISFKDNDNNKYTNCINSRSQVENYSNGEEINQKAEILSAHENRPEYSGTPYNFDEMKKLVNEEKKNTYMTAETGAIDVNFEYNRTGTEDNYTNTSDTGHNNIGSTNYEMAGHYVLENLDFGLEQRPKAQLKVTKQITNVKLTLANNSVLFDASGRATNVLWIDHEAHGQDTKNTYSTNNNYANSMMKTPVVRQNATNKGKVQLTMDEELMHGSTIQITYAITVANIGEVDYKEDQFYYTGTVGNTSTIVKTNPIRLVDYVGTQVHEYGTGDDKTATRNNLQFNAGQNPDWSVISSTDLINNGYVNSKLTDNVNKYANGHIIVTESASKDLIPIIADQDKVEDKIKNAFNKDPLHALETVNNTQSTSGVSLILTQMITQDNDSDDRAYNNMTELVTSKNTVGRRMNYSVSGNQDPTIEPREIDSDDSQEVVILPPFGQEHRFYVLEIAIAIILIVGIGATIMVVRKRK